MEPQSLLVEMGELVENQLARASRALLEGDWPGAQRVIALDPDVDALERVAEHAVHVAGAAIYTAEGRLPPGAPVRPAERPAA